MSPVKEMTLAPVPEQSPVVSESDAIIKAAMDPNVDTAKLSALIDMRERVMKIQAKAAFDSAFAMMQADIPEIDERGKLIVKGQLRSTYARLEDIHAAIKPVLKEHGFAMRHRTEWPADKPNVIRIVGILSHREGHSEESIFEAPLDKSEYRTDIQSMGSTVSYGRRYTTLDLLNITTRGLDDDARQKPQPEKAPEGYAVWLEALIAKADEGLPALQQMWAVAKADDNLKGYLAHLTKTAPETWNGLKKKAATVTK
jgi:hypothetical protein